MKDSVLPALEDDLMWNEDEFDNKALAENQQRRAKINFSGDQYLGPPLKVVEAKLPVTRLDHVDKSLAPKDFSKNQQSYVHNKDWSHSGNAQGQKYSAWKPHQKVNKGTFGGSLHETAPYAAPRHVPWLQYKHPKTGKSTVVFDKKHEQEVRKARPTLSKWSNGKQSRFKVLDSGEDFSNKPGRPTAQKIITDPVKHMQDNGHNVKFVNNIYKHRKKLEDRKIPFSAEWPNNEIKAKDSKMSLKEKVQATFQIEAAPKHQSAKKHHQRMMKLHQAEVDHHGKRIEYMKNYIADHPERPEWNKDYEGPIKKHVAFKDYHEKMAAMHAKKCKNC
jgi:hypothetical protein